MNDHQLGKQFTPTTILTFALPTLFMMLFMSTYMIIDGVFVAKFLDEASFSALNMAFPVISFVNALSLMLAMGSNAVIATLMGEGKSQKAREFLTQIYVMGIILGGIICFATIFFVEELLILLNATGTLYQPSKEYLFFSAVFFVFSLLQIFSQTFLVTNGTPMLGFFVCLAGGCTNIFFDYLFIAVFQWGIKGAALATGLGYCVAGLFSLFFFSFVRTAPLHFVKFTWDFPNLFRSLSNGMSEFVTNLAVSISTFLFNLILLQMAGDAGVAAITAILYVQLFQMGLYTGFSFGVSPLISFKYGANDHPQLQKLVKVSLMVMVVFSISVIILSVLFVDFAIGIFIPPYSSTFQMAKNGFLIYSIGYLFMGINVFMSAFFTALSNGKVSAFLSCSRTLVFIVIFLLTLPHYFGINGVWMAVPLAEFFSLFLSVFFFQKYKKTYHY